MIIERYRKDYLGEFVITSSVWSGGKKSQTRDWIPNPIENHHISGRAVCIANRSDQEQFDHKVLQRHRGGLLGSLKVQTYGTVDISTDMRLDFVVAKEQADLTIILDNNYAKQNIVYTVPKFCLTNPGMFYPIPYNPPLVVEAVLPYLAAFDGHKEVFMLGYHGESPISNSSWFDHIAKVFQTYRQTTFWLVGRTSNIPDLWMMTPNVKKMTFKEFKYYADI